MNQHKKSSPGFNFAEITLLVIAGVILLGAGVTHAWLKNSQVEVAREIDQTQQRINDHQDSINSLQVKIDKKLNIYQLRDDLEKGESALVAIPVSAIERIPPYNRRTSPDPPSAVAQRQP